MKSDATPEERESVDKYVKSISKPTGVDFKALLEQEPLEVEATELQKAYNKGFEDCRQAVIDELNKWDWQELYLPIHFKENIIDVVPPVNPQEPYGDKYIKVPKNALKYRTAGMVAYNVEWLKYHFDIERAVIRGEQEPNTGHKESEDK